MPTIRRGLDYFVIGSCENSDLRGKIVLVSERDPQLLSPERKRHEKREFVYKNIPQVVQITITIFAPSFELGRNVQKANDTVFHIYFYYYNITLEDSSTYL